MLAMPASSPPEEDGWAFEPKLDGWRVLVTVQSGVVEVTTRAGRRITESVPELWPLADALDGDAVLDGELIAGQGLPDDFYRLAPRLSATRPNAVRRWSHRVPLTLAVFDVLEVDGEPVVHDPYADRRLLLEGMSLSAPHWLTVSSVVSDGLELFAACDRLGFEGLVAKHLGSRYEAGRRSRKWMKVKTSAWRAVHAPRRRSDARVL
jgi:bifunctional non-homologous end joining protein LigD